jgi:hypothetical protein
MTDEPTFRDMTTADAELFAHDAKKPRHEVTTCRTPACWACHHQGFRRCAWCGEGEVTEGGLCVRCAAARFGETA